MNLSRAEIRFIAVSSAVSIVLLISGLIRLAVD